MVLVACGATLLLAGCGPKRVRADFTHYENSYAFTSNQEALLNLARLQQHDPTYFFKLGQISSSYRMEASLTGNGQASTITNPPASIIPTGGGSPGLIYENDPSFSFVPVNDQANAQLLLQPVSENIFYSLFQQGWRVDQLFRLMVDRIEVTLPPDPASTDKGCRIEVIRNAPPPSYYGSNFSQSASDVDRYVTFLRVSAVVYALQKHGLLLLRGTNTFQAVDKNSFIPNEAPASAAKGGGQKQVGTLTTPPPDVVNIDVNAQGGGGAAGANGKNAQLPAAKDFNDAATAGREWELQGANDDNKGGVWVLGQKTLEPKFQLNTMVPDPDESSEAIYGDNVKTVETLLRTDLLKNDPSLKVLASAPELTDTLEILFSGFAIGGSATDQDTGIGPCTSSDQDTGSGTSPGQGNPSGQASVPKHGIVTSHLVLRSLIGLMAAAAQEQDFYDQMAKSGDPQVPVTVDPLIAEIHKGLLTAAIGLNPKIKDATSFPVLPPGTTVPFSYLVPPIERLPVLRLSWPDDVNPSPGSFASGARELGLAVTYRGKEYLVADADLAKVVDLDPDKPKVSDFARENGTWNRDMFRLIDELSSQVTVDISKFPLPEILQLRTE
jgi:hypothetical protein